MSAAATLAGAAPDLAPGWHSINWRKVWRNVRRLQARIVKAVQEGSRSREAKAATPSIKGVGNQDRAVGLTDVKRS